MRPARQNFRPDFIAEWRAQRRQRYIQDGDHLSSRETATAEALQPPVIKGPFDRLTTAPDSRLVLSALASNGAWQTKLLKTGQWHIKFLSIEGRCAAGGAKRILGCLVLSAFV